MHFAWFLRLFSVAFSLLFRWHSVASQSGCLECILLGFFVGFLLLFLYFRWYSEASLRRCPDAFLGFPRPPCLAQQVSWAAPHKGAAGASTGMACHTQAGMKFHRAWFFGSCTACTSSAVTPAHRLHIACTSPAHRLHIAWVFRLVSVAFSLLFRWYSVASQRGCSECILLGFFVCFSVAFSLLFRLHSVASQRGCPESILLGFFVCFLLLFLCFLLAFRGFSERLP